MGTSVQTTPPDTDFYRAFASRVRETVAAEHTRAADLVPAAKPDPLESALLSAWNNSEPDMPECHVCGDQEGPWVPVPSGDRWPSGAQKLVCSAGHDPEQGSAAAAVQRPPAVQPRTWSFTDKRSGRQVTVTCMAGCVLDHTYDAEQPRFPEDIQCETWGRAVSLPVNDSGRPEPRRILTADIRVSPFAEDSAQRLPQVSLEVLDDHWVQDLDPEGLRGVIMTLASRLDDLRAVHSRLVSVRAEYAGRTDAAEALRGLLAGLGIPLVPMTQPCEDPLTEPLLTGPDIEGARYLLVPPGHRPVDTLAYVLRELGPAARPAGGERA